MSWVLPWSIQAFITGLTHYLSYNIKLTAVIILNIFNLIQSWNSSNNIHTMCNKPADVFVECVCAGSVVFKQTNSLDRFQVLYMASPSQNVKSLPFDKLPPVWLRIGGGRRCPFCCSPCSMSCVFVCFTENTCVSVP